MDPRTKIKKIAIFAQIWL